MIEFERFTLENGLRVLIHEAPGSKIAAVSVLYDVGTKDEKRELSGLAHLFEHLMFSGSAHVKDFDEPIQKAGGENNAFTNSDFTNFYNYVPANNLELLLWMESDRMKNLKLTKSKLQVQQKVVVEEFYETTLNQPYGTSWHHLLEMAYDRAPYQWPTIGIEPDHIKKVTLEEASAFYETYYKPNNAVLAISGGLDPKKVKELVIKWFSDIAPSNLGPRNFGEEPTSKGKREKILVEKVPSASLFMAFNMCKRLHSDFYAFDLLTDVLAGGGSSRFYQNLYKKKELFTHIDTYITASIEEGLLVVEGRLQEGIDLATAEAAIWEELYQVSHQAIEKRELEKLKNKAESNFLISELNIVNRAINLCYFELLQDANLINSEIKAYQKVSADQIQEMAKKALQDQNVSILKYQI
jgi:zinc protease